MACREPGTQSLWSDAPDANLLGGGASGRMPIAEARNLYSDIAGARLADPANWLEPGNGRVDRASLGLDSLDPESTDELLEAFRSLRPMGDPGLQGAAIVDYPGGAPANRVPGDPGRRAARP